MARPRGGKRIGAGRKTLEEEVKKNRTITRAWDYLAKRLLDSNTQPDERLKIALTICPRTIKQEASVDSKVSGDIQIKWAEDGNNNNPV